MEIQLDIEISLWLYDLILFMIYVFNLHIYFISFIRIYILFYLFSILLYFIYDVLDGGICSTNNTIQIVPRIFDIIFLI